jgi:hypothetical protein
VFSRQGDGVLKVVLFPQGVPADRRLWYEHAEVVG